MKILIAEDDETSRKTLANMLQKLDYEVVVTPDGAWAWQELQQPDPPELLVLDIVMPKIDGLELCRKIREHYTDNPPYIILLTAKKDKENIVQGLESGANDYVIKPYDFDELKARIGVGERVLRIQSGYLNKISELKLTEEALRESEAKFRSVFDSSNDAFLIHDMQGCFLEVNSAACKNLGYTRDELLQMSIMDIDTPENASLVSERLKRIEEEGYIIFESAHRARDGSEFPVEINCRKMEYQGKACILSVVRDISERNKAEEALRQSEERFKKLFDTNPDAVALVDKQGKFLMVNPVMADNFCMTPEELSGKSFHEVMQHHLAESRIAKLQEALEQNDQLFYEDEREGIQFQNVIIPIATSKDKRVLQIIARDVTDQKKMQERLTELSIYDSLTKLYSRYLFEEEMKRLGDGRYCPIAIIICDIDGLKLINDTLGHHKGDKFLIDTADILRNAFRSSDIISRIGGDEFAILLPRCTENCIQDCKNRIHKELEEYNKSNSDFGLSVSIGYAIKFNPPVDMKHLFKKADDAMYKEKLEQNASSRSTIVQALFKALESKDYFIEDRTERLYYLVHMLGKAYSISESKLNKLSLLAKFHDFGEVGISDNILFKQGPLSDDEYQEMKKHCEIGQRIALFTSDLAPVADLILKHHEWWNGQGYPLGLQGEDIPIECRVMAIVDAYDSMTSERPYKNKISQQEAIKELRRCAGTQFDPDLVDLFIQILPSHL